MEHSIAVVCENGASEERVLVRLVSDAAEHAGAGHAPRIEERGGAEGDGVVELEAVV